MYVDMHASKVSEILMTGLIYPKKVANRVVWIGLHVFFMYVCRCGKLNRQPDAHDGFSERIINLSTGLLLRLQGPAWLGHTLVFGVAMLSSPN